MHGIVLLAGLVRGELPPFFDPFLGRRYKHYLGGTHGTVDIMRLELSVRDAPAVAIALSECLLPERYYARLNDEQEMFVSFPSTVSHLRRGSAEDLERAIRVGLCFGVDRGHMRFAEMFDLDHPEMHPSPDAS